MEVVRFSAWAPGVESLDDWANGKPIEDSSASPKIDFASPIAIRRLSQLTRMTCFMAHRIGLDADELFFSSVRGEIGSQFRINAAYAREGEMKPASFSLSVFNAAPAQATILLGSRIPYAAIFSGEEECMRNLFLAASAPLQSGRLSSTIMIYAEESIPAEYRKNVSSILPPMVLGIELKATGSEEMPATALESPRALLAHLIQTERHKWVS